MLVSDLVILLFHSSQLQHRNIVKKDMRKGIIHFLVLLHSAQEILQVFVRTRDFRSC